MLNDDFIATIEGENVVNAKSGHTLERARTRSKIVKMINTSSLPTPTG